MKGHGRFSGFLIWMYGSKLIIQPTQLLPGVWQLHQKTNFRTREIPRSGSTAKDREKKKKRKEREKN